jgi:hypothetical protein
MDSGIWGARNNVVATGPIHARIDSGAKRLLPSTHPRATWYADLNFEMGFLVVPFTWNSKSPISSFTIMVMYPGKPMTRSCLSCICTVEGMERTGGKIITNTGAWWERQL